MIGYDLDGVLCPKPPKRNKPYNHQTSSERQAYKELRRGLCQTDPLILTPAGDYYIITARPKWLIKETEEWIERVGLRPKGICFIDKARTRKNMIEFKVQIIRQFNIQKFYEDDPKIVRAIRRQLPKVEVIQV